MLIQFAHIFLNFALELPIDLGVEVVLELGPTHWARQVPAEDLLLALEAEEMLARRDDWFYAEIHADWTLVVLVAQPEHPYFR